MSTFEGVNAGGNPSSVCMIISEMNHKSLLDSETVLHLQMKIYLNMLVLETKCGHALDVVDMLEKDDLSQSGNPWLWYSLSQESHKSDEHQDPRTHTGVLVGPHDHNSDIHTLP